MQNMTVRAISTIEPQQKKSHNHTALATVAGAAAGALSRYVIPAKSEMKDGFFSSAQMSARGESRSILKYAGIGALIAFGVNRIINAFSPDKKEEKPAKESVYDSFYNSFDSADCAYEIMWLA